MTISRVHGTQQSLNGAIKSICDIMRRSNCAGALQYIPELTWMLFLRMLDEHEQSEVERTAGSEAEFAFSLEYPYRWRDWAAPDGIKRVELQFAPQGMFFKFIADDLVPYLAGIGSRSGATPRQRVISQVFSSVSGARVDTEQNLREILDKIHEITAAGVDPTHIFTMSQIYEGLLLKMGEKANDGGQFFTPREVVRAMVQVLDPKVGETVYDPCCGTGGFLAQAHEYMLSTLGPGTTDRQRRMLTTSTFFGREKEDLVYPIALANLVLHGIDEPHIWHGNSLTDRASHSDLFQEVPDCFDIVLTNPPFGGKEGKDTQKNFAFQTSATQVLFLQHIIDKLKDGGRCGIVLDEGVLFRINERGFVQTKRKLLDTCNLWCIVSLPIGIFASAGTGVKTNLLFFTKGQRTEHIWYYDLSDTRVGKRTPFTLDKFQDFLRLLPERGESDRSWIVTRKEIEARGYDLKAVNPHYRSTTDTRTAGELLKQIEIEGKEIAELVATLRA